MRQPNYRVGWYIPQQIAALTHFHADVTGEDFLGIVQAGQELLRSVHNEFHIIIDNRKVGMSSPVSLSQMKQMVPYMNHPLLRWVVVVKPEHLVLERENLQIEQEGDVRLKNVSSLAEGFSYLRQLPGDLRWSQADRAFFPDAEQIMGSHEP
jgi:hypothetical protein